MIKKLTAPWRVCVTLWMLPVRQAVFAGLAELIDMVQADLKLRWMSSPLGLGCLGGNGTTWPLVGRSLRPSAKGISYPVPL